MNQTTAGGHEVPVCHRSLTPGLVCLFDTEDTGETEEEQRRIIHLPSLSDRVYFNAAVSVNLEITDTFDLSRVSVSK